MLRFSPNGEFIAVGMHSSNIVLIDAKAEINHQSKTGATAPGSSQASERSDYFRSPPCQQELRRAMSTKTPIVWVLETDPAHGGIAMESHLHDCPDDIRPMLEAAIAAQEVIDWHRIRSFQDTSLRLILQRRAAAVRLAWTSAAPKREVGWRRRVVLLVLFLANSAQHIAAI